jgi:hypothetical protein
MREDLIRAVTFTLLARRLGKLIKLAEDESFTTVRQSIEEDIIFLKRQLKRML